MLKFFRIPFATSGDRAAIPEAVDPGGAVSFTEGYGFDYQRDLSSDPAAKAIERDKMNGLFFDLSTAISELQSQGIPDFITSALNGGSAYSYAANALVRYSGDIYVSLVGGNTALPTDATKWALLPTPARLQNATYLRATAGGSADAITATFAPALLALPAAPGTLSVIVRAAAANATTTPTFAPDGLPAKVIVKGANAPLSAGDIGGAGHWLFLTFDPTLDKWVLANPTLSVASTLEAQGLSNNTKAITPLRLEEAFQGANKGSGWQRLPGGRILQWGGTVAGTSGTITFPLAWPSAMLAIVSANQATTGTPTGTPTFRTQTPTNIAWVRPDSVAFLWAAIGE